MPSAMSTSMGSIRRRSAPVSRSRSQSAVRGPKRRPLCEIVPSGMRRAKASQRPSGETSGAMPPPLEVCPCCTVIPDVISSTCPVFEVEPPDLLVALHEVGAPGPGPGGRRADLEVQGTAVRREGRPRGPGVVRPDELNAFAPVTRIHPQAGSAAAALGGRASHHDEAAVRRPRRLPGTQRLALEHRPRIRPVGVHQPEVVLSATVGNERDRRAVRREAGVEVHRYAAALGQRNRLAARCRHPVDVSEQVEDDPFAIRGDIDRHPRAFAGGEFDLAGLPARGGDVPILCFATRFLGLECRCLDQREPQRGSPQGRQNEPANAWQR